MCLESRTSELQDASLSSRKLAILRIDSLDVDGRGSTDTSGNGCSFQIGLANELNGILQEALSKATNDLSPLFRVLQILENVTINDETLSEEVDTSKGFRDCLRKIINLQQISINEEILLNSIQALAVTIENSLSTLETTNKVDPFTSTQLQSRLPLIFGKSQSYEQQSNLEVMVHQVTSEEETETHDTGYVMWPSSVILARLITDNSSLILDYNGDNNSDVLELGAGCGLVGLTAAALLRQRNEECKIRCDESRRELVHDDLYCNAKVIFTDYLPTVLENLERNIGLNDFNEKFTKVAGLDFFDQPGNYDSEYDGSQPNWIDMTGAKQPQVRLVLAADVLAYSNDAINVANTIYAALVEGGKAVVVSADESKRYGVAEFPEACRNAGLEITTSRCKFDGLSDSAEADASIKETFVHMLEHTVGHGLETGYNTIIFNIEKPMASK